MGIRVWSSAGKDREGKTKNEEVQRKVRLLPPIFEIVRF